MGKPFEAELGRLGECYSFASKCDVSGLARLVSHTLEGPIIASGSGGSYTAAVIFRQLHFRATGIPSLALTPLDLSSIPFVTPRTSIWLLSARGRNSDILSAARSALTLEPHLVASLTASAKSPIEELLSRSSLGSAFTFESPAGRDGYLATNSLFVTTVLLQRAYDLALGIANAAPSLGHLLDDVSEQVDSRDQELSALWQFPTILVIHDVESAVAAVDFESKATEAALCSIKTANLRDFAHGRHHWLTRFGDDTAVLFITGSEQRRLAERTARLFPKGIVTAFRTLPGAPEYTSGLLEAFFLTASLGRSKNVDPGRPGIAAFGSKIYGLSQTRTHKAISICHAAALRKSAAGSFEEISVIEHYAEEAIAHLESTVFHGIVCDLDGTLVPRGERWQVTCSREVRAELDRIVASGVNIAVATGRAPTNKSLKLLRSLVDTSFWPKIIVGFYNGALIKSLADEEIAQVDQEGPLEPIHDYLKKRLGRSSTLRRSFCIEASRYQITLRAEKDTNVSFPHSFFELANEAVVNTSIHAKVTRSSHSVDIVISTTSKTNVLGAMNLPSGQNVIRFGDMGQWPGNDCELLATPYGLSVNRVSTDLRACWNLLPRGLIETDGLLHYLRHLNSAGNSGAKFEELAQCRADSP